MRTLEEVANYMDVYERYHPERNPTEIRKMTLSLISQLPQKEKDKFLENYYEYVDSQVYEPVEDIEISDDYLINYTETNEGV